ncbi:AraC family transcriptional regulator [Oceaniserpentilla sp. 4NH20-0058]|uniref:AraC family transcriptional regulator n=1 Tax=Oceaniserpentilla sp. 4NH20-0058 TaxID=3127660 RepID=UPI00310AA061
MNSDHKRVSIHWIKAILQAAQSLGVEPHAILKSLNLNLDLDANQPAYLSLDQTQDIWKVAEEKSAHAYFGLKMGQRVRPSYFHAVAYVAMTSTNLMQAYENFSAYMPLISEGAELDMAFEGKKMWIYFTPKPDNKPFSRHQHESIVALLLEFSRWLLGDDSLVPMQVTFPHEAGPDLSVYESILSVKPKFKAPQTAIQFPVEYLSRKLKESDAGLHALHKAHADQMLAAHTNSSWRVKVVHCILPSDQFQISREQVANKLNVSSRTLQRRLKEEGTNYLDILDDQRKQKAQELIFMTNRSLKDVAIELGFAESSTFYRACHRWFNDTPKALRLKQQNGQS